MTPQLRFPGFTDEWQVKKLGDIGSTYSGLTGKSGDDFGAGSNFITYMQIFSSSKISQNFGKVMIVKNEKQNKVQYGDIFFTTSSETPEETGYTSVLLDSPADTYLNSFCFGYRADKNILSPEFARFLFHSSRVRSLIVRLAQGSTRYNISKVQTMHVSVELPPIDEQKRIADFLTAVDERIAVGEKKLELLETYKRGVMQKIFSQQIRFKDENGNPYPDWEEKKLGEISVIKTGKKDANIAKSDGEYRFYTCSRDYLHTDVYSFEGEAILVAGNADVGLCHYYNGEFEAYQRTYVLQNFKTDGKYLYKYLSHFFRQYALGLMQSSAMTYITLGTLENFTVPLPSEEEQQKIATFLTSLDDKITAEKSKLTAARQFKKALLQRMFV